MTKANVVITIINSRNFFDNTFKLQPKEIDLSNTERISNCFTFFYFTRKINFFSKMSRTFELLIQK